MLSSMMSAFSNTAGALSAASEPPAPPAEDSAAKRKAPSRRAPPAAPASPAQATAGASGGSNTAKRASQYALSDEQYLEWRSTLDALKAQPESSAPLRQLEGKTELLNWRNPATGQTLLTALATSAASETVLKAAVDMGCDSTGQNAYGETAYMVANRKGYRMAGGFGMSSMSSGNLGPQMSTTRSQQSLRRASWMPASRRMGRGAGPADDDLRGQDSDEASSALNLFGSSSSAPTSSVATKRRSGVMLGANQVAAVPKAQMSLDLDWNAEKTLDRKDLESALQQTYGPRARIAIDEVVDKSIVASRNFRACSGRVQNVKCRVMFDDDNEAREQQVRSTTGRAVQAQLAANMGLAATAVDFEAEAKMDEVNMLTLKLDSDSSSILCGACLLYNTEGECEKVVCHSDRLFASAVKHSGDTKVDGKSVHTITLAMSKLPDEVAELYFTLCSCGPSDLSGFRNPSIMLYDSSMPDANLLEYTIERAAKSPSVVMAKMLRQPSWSKGDETVIKRALRTMKMPLLCIDLCMAMAAQSTWAIQALGTEEWHCQKVCSQYDIAKIIIETRLKAEKEAKERKAVPPTTSASVSP